MSAPEPSPGTATAVAAWGRDLRRVPLWIATQMATFASERRSLVFLYIVILVYVVPFVGIVLLR